MKNNLAFDWRFFLKFAVIYLVLYYFNLAFWGLVDPNAHYSPFLDTYLNYISWIISSVLAFSGLVINLLGTPAQVEGAFLFTPGGTSLQMIAPCAGLGIMSFWAAFLFAGTTPLKFKLKWLVIGWTAIWLVNCTRMILLFFAFENNWSLAHLGAHEMFNYAAYLVIGLLVWKVHRLAGAHTTSHNYSKQKEQVSAAV